MVLNQNLKPNPHYLRGELGVQSLESVRQVTYSDANYVYANGYLLLGNDNGIQKGSLKSRMDKFTGKPVSATTGLYYDYLRSNCPYFVAAHSTSIRSDLIDQSIAESEPFLIRKECAFCHSSFFRHSKCELLKIDCNPQTSIDHVTFWNQQN